MWVPKGWSPEGCGPGGWGPEGCGPEGWSHPEGCGAQNFALFFPSPTHHFRYFSLSLGVFSWNGGDIVEILLLMGLMGGKA